MSAAFKPVRHRYEDALTRLSWREFQQRIAAHFEGLGYQVECTTTGDPAERGSDLMLCRGEETIIASCKHWSAFQVPHGDVHRLLGQLPTAGATGALLITSGEFTRAAIDAAARFRHLRLIDGRALRALLGPIEEPHAFRLPPPDSPIWAPVSPGTAASRAADNTTASRASAMAAVAAVLVMAVAMVTLYTWYIRDIHEAPSGDVAGARAVYRHDGALPAPPPFAQPAHPPGTGGTP